MKELSLNILDIAQNSVKAGASNITLELIEEGNLFTFRITDAAGNAIEETWKIRRP